MTLPTSLPRRAARAATLLPSLVLGAWLAAGPAGCADATDPAAAPAERTTLPRDLAPAERRLLDAGSEFSWTLLRRVSEQERGRTVVLSPLSASVALGMTLDGAAGSTLEEMRATLGLAGLSNAEIDAGYQSSLALLRAVDPTVELQAANAIFPDRALPLRQGFVDAVRQWFGADVLPLDFASPSATSSINDWVRRRTQGRITRIVDDTRGEVMYLLNAIYFKAPWRTRFDPSQTGDGEFRAADGTRQPARFMYRGGTLRRFATPEAEGIVLPYGNGAFTMTIVLPREGISVDALAESMSGARWAAWQAQARDEPMDLYLPRFTLAYERSLGDDLVALGMADAFSPARADFSRMSPARLYLGTVKQKTWIQVDEAGTEAAAVTSVGIRVTSLPAAMRVDRPFLFVISEHLSGAVVFVGKVAKL